MARKKSSNLYVIIGAAFAVVVVVVAAVVGLLVHAASEEDEESSETSSVSDSDSSESNDPDEEDSSSDDSDPDEPDGPAGPILPSLDDEEGEPDEGENNEEDETSSSEESSSSEPSSSAAPPPSSSAAQVTKPSSSAPPKSSVQSPAPSSSKAPAPSSSSNKTTVSSSKSTASTTSKSSTVTVKPTSSKSSSKSSSKGSIIIKSSTSSKTSSKVNTSGEKLETPEIEATSTNGRINVSWNEVENASGYKVDIYKGEVSNTSTAKPVETVTLDEDETSYTSTDVSVVNDTIYTVKVQALGGNGYSDSNLRRASVKGKASSGGGLSGLLGKKLKTPENLIADLDDDILTISWEDVDDAYNYTVELYRPNGKLLESDTTRDSDYTFSEELDEKGSYKVQVQANPKSSSSYKPSAFASKSVKVSSGSASGTRLEAPSFTVKQYKEYTAIKWSTVKNAEEYQLEILNPSGGIEHEYTIEEGEENPYEWYGDMLKKGTWKFRMKAIDLDGDYKDSSFTTKSIEVGAGELEVPGDVEVGVDDDTATVSFSVVDDAQFYRLSLSGKEKRTKDHRPSGISASRGTQSYKFTKLPSGKYTVKVRACTEDDSLNNSDWSGEVSFTID